MTKVHWILFSLRTNMGKIEAPVLRAGRPRRGEGRLTEERDGNAPAPLLLVCHKIKNLISVETVQRFFNGSGDRFR